MEKKLLNIKDVCAYTGWGETKTRKIVTDPDNHFAFRVGNRLYVNKDLFDKYLDECAEERRRIT